MEALDGESLKRRKKGVEKNNKRFGSRKRFYGGWREGREGGGQMLMCDMHPCSEWWRERGKRKHT